MMNNKTTTHGRGLTVLLVAAVLIVAILAGRLVLRDSDAEFAVKPATGSAQAMAAASTVESGAAKR